MITKSEIKHITSLKQKKYRHQYNEFIVEGEKSLCELLKSDIEIKSIHALKGWIEENGESLSSREIDASEITESELKKISSFSAPNKVLAVARMPEKDNITEEIYSDLSLALDDIRDPGNLGMIIRTADWFGIRHIVCSVESVDAFNPKVVQSSMGSLFRVCVHYTDLHGYILKAPEGTSVYGAFIDGDVIFQKRLQKRGIIIIGNESRGISDRLDPLVSEKIMIPPFPVLNANDDRAESLNAALANAVLLYEFRRQHQSGGE